MNNNNIDLGPPLGERNPVINSPSVTPEPYQHETSNPSHAPDIISVQDNTNMP